MDTECTESPTASLLVQEDHGEPGTSGEPEGRDPVPGGSSSSSSSSSSSVTSVLVLSTLVASCGSYMYGNAIGFSSPAETGIRNELGLSLAEYSFFGSILTIGAMIGALLSGRLADMIGRRGAMWVSDVLCIFGWLSIGCASGTLWLDIGRLLVGSAIGISSYAVPVYIAEITPKDLRGSFTAFNAFINGCGTSLAFFVGSLIYWRAFALAGAIPALIQLVGLIFIPESPRWLANVGQEPEFTSALIRLRGKTVDTSMEASDIKDCTMQIQGLSRKRFTDMFQRKYRHAITVGVGLTVFQQFGGLKGISFYSTTIFESAGFPSKIGNIAVAIVKLPMSALGVILMDRSGRHPLLLVSATGACLGSLLSGVSFLLQDFHFWKELTPVFTLIGILIYIAAYELGLTGIPWIIMSEIFPMDIKGSAGSLVILVCWFGSWVISYTFSYMFEWSSAGTLFIYSCICGAGVLFVARLVPETKGRTLEEIHTSITDGSWRCS